MKRIYVVGTADTKGEELAFLAETSSPTPAFLCALVDVGTRAADGASATSSAREIAAQHSRRRRRRP